MAPYFPTPIITDGLVAEYHFDGDTQDSSGNSNHGSNHGATFVEGISGQGLSFDGLDDYFDYGISNNFNWESTSSFTYDFWLKTTENYGMLFSQRSITSQSPVVNIALGYSGFTTFGGGEIVVLIRDDYGSVAGCFSGCTEVNSNTVVNDGNFHHIAIVRDVAEDNVKIYIDGELKSNVIDQLSAGMTTDMRTIGNEKSWVNLNFGTPDQRFFNGIIDEVRIYNRALTGDEIKEHCGIVKSLLQVEGHSEVYWLQNNRLYWVTDWDVINNMAGVPGWDSVNTLPASEFDPAAYTQGPRFITTGAESDGLLIQEQGDIEVYLIQGGEKHHFTSPEALLWNGYSFDDVINVSAAISGMFSSGSDISITQAIIDKYYEQGDEATFGLSLGTGENFGDEDSAGVNCSYVNFQNGAIECFASGDLEGNAYAIVNPFFNKWADMGYGRSVLGYPVSDISEVEYSSFNTPFQYQNFINGTERGALELNFTSGEVFEIHGAIFAKWEEKGFASGIMGLVIEDEKEAAQSPQGTTGRYSKFENGTIHWISDKNDDNLGHLNRGSSFITYGGLDAKHTSMSGTASWLGFPVMDQEERDGYGYCEFEGGYIEWDEIEGEYRVVPYNPNSNLIPVITTNRTMFDGKIVVEENKAINFSGLDSYDEFGSIVIYKWDFGDGSPIELGENISHRYNQMGEYGVILNVTNNAGVSSQTSVKVLVVKQIVEGLVLLSDFTDKLWNLQMATIYENEKKVTNYYLDVSYQSNYINFTTYPSIIHINKKISEYNKNLIQYYIINDTLNKLPNKYVNQDFVLVVATDYGEKEMAFPCITDNEPNCNYPYSIAVVKSNSSDIYYRFWAHEIGHTLGRKLISSKRYNDYDLLWDLYPNGFIKTQNGVKIRNAGEVSNIWELMAYGDNLPPPHFSSMSKVLLGWMVPKLILRGETVKMYAIEQGIYGENAFIHCGLNDVQYVIEAREKPKNKVVIYKLEDYDLINDLVMPTAKNTVSISNMNKYYDLNNFVYFKVSEESTNPYSVKVTITDPTLTQRIKGVVLDTKTLLSPTTLPLLNGCLNKPNYTFPDIDLHVVSPDGKHVGVNYTSGLYENEIHGALSSGDLINDKEWIFVPSDINVAYYISSHDVQKFLEENPDINATNATIEYSVTFMEYGLNPKLIQLPDGNWTVQNRTSSEPQIEIIEPGEMKQIIFPDITTLTTITNLSSTNGTFWINWTWTTPSDPDFNHTQIYLNSLHQTNTSTTFFNATSLTPNTEYTLSTRTVDTSGNINTTWVNNTAITLNTPPISNASGPYTGIEGHSIIFNASASYDPDPGDSIISFEWDFNNDNIPDATGIEVIRIWNDDHTGEVNLTVTDSHGESSTDITYVNILNVPPEAEAGNDQTVDEGDVVSFSANFTDPGTEDTHTIEWAFGDGTTDTGTLTPTHVYADDGTYTVTVSISDDDGASDSDTLMVTVMNALPVVEAGADQTVDEGIEVSFLVAFNDKGTSDTHIATINWGDGTAAEPGTVTESPSGPPGSTSGVSGTVSGSHVYADNGIYTIEVCITDDDGDSGCDTLEVTVINKAPIVSSNRSEVTVQWSDQITSITISATDVEADLPLSISTSWKKEDETDFTASPPLPDKLILNNENCTINEATATCTWTLEGLAFMAPGTYIVNASVNDNAGASSCIDITVNVTPEDARATYTGSLFTSTSSVNSGIATVTLSATIQDITAVTRDIAHDPYTGDIRNAEVKFIDRETNSVLCIAPVGLVTLSDNKTGTATCDWVVDIGQADSQDFTIGIVVNDYYIRDASADNSIVTISKPLDDFITGGGYLIMTNSTGLYPSDAGTKANFGFNVKYNKKGTNLKGRVNIIIRNGDRVYQIKSNAINQLSVDSPNATFDSKANIQDITDPLNPISIDGNAALQMTLTDNGEPGSSDSIAITVWNKNGGLWYSSNWDGTKTIEQSLDGGNLVVK
jgi:PKD repeat protein